MTRPDPASDLVGSMRWLMDQIEAMKQSSSGRRLSASAAAEALGYGPRYLHGKPWCIPGFGLSGNLHTLGAWETWLARPEAERRAEWDAMGIRSRRLARGVAS